MVVPAVVVSVVATAEVAVVAGPAVAGAGGEIGTRHHAPIVHPVVVPSLFARLVKLLRAAAT